MVFWVFFDKKQGKFCQNLVALFPFAAKIVGAQKNPLQSVQSPQNQCQKILISVVPDKRKHTYKANYTYFPFFWKVLSQGMMCGCGLSVIDMTFF